MWIIKFRAFFFWLTGLILAGSIGALLFFGLPLSIDFTGGSLVEVEYVAERPAIPEIQQTVRDAGFSDALVRGSKERGVTVRTHTLEESEKAELLTVLRGGGDLTELRATTIGPSLGTELAIKSLYALLVVAFVIMLYIAWVFRKVSRPVPSWGYGFIVILMLIIDIIVPTGFYAAYAHFTGAQADALFVVALLALMGYAVNDVIVIFDRVRENLKKNEEQNVEEEFEVTVGRSIDETIGRSINTSLTVVLALLAIMIFGAEVTRDFALVMLVGVVVGTFSSICRSAPLLVPLAKMFNKEKA